MLDDAIRELRSVVDAAERAIEAERYLRVVKEERDAWRRVAEELGTRSLFEYDTSRRHLRLQFIIDEQVLALAKDKLALVQEFLLRAHEEFRDKILGMG